MTDNKTTEPPQRRDGLHCVYGECQGLLKHPRLCHPGCSFQMSAISELELLRRSLGVSGT